MSIPGLNLSDQTIRIWIASYLFQIDKWHGEVTDLS